MRILIVSDITGYMRGGVPVETRHLLDGLTARGHVVGLVSDIPLPGMKSAFHYSIAVPIDARLAEVLQSAIVSFKPDVVHVMAMSSRGIIRIGPILKGRPWILTTHSLPPGETKLNAFHSNETLHYGFRALRFLANGLAWRWLMSRGAIPRVIVHSRHMQEQTARYGYPLERIALIALGCAAAAAPRAPRSRAEMGDAPRVVTVGGIAHTKGLHDAIAALQTLRARYPKIQYRIIGEMRDATYLAFLQSLVERLSLHAHVSIEQGVSEAGKVAALQAADLYVQPSHEEGFCLSYIEAASVVPRLVGTDTGAIAAISEGDPGARVVPVRRPELIAIEAGKLLDADLPEDLGARRQERLNRTFGWPQYLAAHELVYADLIGSASDSGRA